MQKIYISGTITGKEEQAFKEFQDAENYLNDLEYAIEKLSYKVINPFKLKHNHDKSWESYMKECLNALLKCDCIYMLNGYENSKGAMLELNVAVSLGFSVYYQSDSSEPL